ncbi:MAG: glycoside hydrolase family 3 protein [bacterium]|nr:glycoside hydrolase family 3 protein [bacterium]
MDRQLWATLGSIWLLGFAGERVEDDFLRLLDKCQARNLILFRDNLPGGLKSLPALRKRLEEAAGGPLTLFVDEEGGWVQQLEPRSWPSPRSLALNGVEAVDRFHRALGARAAALGVDVVCGPVADLDDGWSNPVIGSRSFGADEIAEASVSAAVRGLLAGGVLPVLKHFPGHGDSLEDSHLTLPSVPGDRSHALPPFRAGFETGGEAVAVMTAHLHVDDGIDASPATFRRDLIRDYLPRETGFSGLVITDALEMGGAAVIPEEDRGRLAFLAGCHLLTLARWQPGAERMLAGMQTPLMRGEISRTMIDEALERRAAFLAARPEPPADPIVIADSEFQALGGSAIMTGGGGAQTWSGETFSIEFGATGSWRREEFTAALDGLPYHVIAEGESLATDTWLWIGRDLPPRARREELTALSTVDAPPLVLVCGPRGWCGDLPRYMVTSDTSPRGLRVFLEHIRRR